MYPHIVDSVGKCIRHAMKVPAPQKEKHLGLILFTLVWFIAIFLVNISGDFPLNDDWSFGMTALTLYRTGRYVPGDWPAMTLITNVVLSVPFVHIFGENFVALRLSSLFYHWMTAIIVYYVSLRKNTVMVAVGLATAVLFSPLPFILSFTFMTESIFQFLCVVILALVVHYRERCTFALTIFSVLATLSRQIILPSLLLPIIYNWTSSPITLRKLRYAMPICISCMCYLLYRWWLESTNRMPANQSSSLNTMLGVFQNGKIAVILGNIQQSVLLGGFLLFPVLLLFFLQHVVLYRKKAFFVSVFLLLFTIISKSIILKSSLLFPYSNNVLSSFGFGPLLFSEGSIVTWHLPIPILVVCSVMSIIGGSTLVMVVCERVKKAWIGRCVNPSLRLYYFSGTLMLLSTMIDPMFDRYVGVVTLIVLLTMVSVGQKCDSNRVNVIYFFAALLFHIGFCVVAGRDYMDINRARSRAYQYITNNVSSNPLIVDAGFEYNGMNQFKHKHFQPVSKNVFTGGFQYGVGFNVPSNCEELYRTTTKVLLGTQTVVVIAYRKRSIPGQTSNPLQRQY